MRSQLRYIIYWLVACHVFFLFLLTLCRIVLCVYNFPESGVFDVHNFLTGIVIGLKFDNLIASYIISIPLVLLPCISLATSFRDNRVLMNKCLTLSKWYLTVLYSITLFVTIANIRYYHFFGNHLNWQVTEWFGFVADTAGMLFGDAVNWLFLLSAAAVSVIVFFSVSRLLKCTNPAEYVVSMNFSKYVVSFVAVILCWGLCFLGMRGSMQRYPLDTSFAYFCNDAFYNRLGINPVFNIIKSAEYADDELPTILSGIEREEAIGYVQDRLHISSGDSVDCIMRISHASDSVLTGKPNVVLILMESMMAANMEREYNGKPLTPCLRELSDNSIYFSNVYSAGVHTNNGIMATQYGIMPNFAHTSMPMPAELHDGLPNILAAHGYSTIAFLTSNPQYDNMNSVLRDNGIQTIYSLYDYPADEVVNNFGVSDAYLFDYGLERLNEYSLTDSAFYAMFLTVSNHIPYVVPKSFEDCGATAEEQIIAYADAAVGNFLRKAKQTKWGRNTLFVIVADHGHINPSDCQYDMTYSFNHIPLFITADWLEPQQITDLACQIDIMPTVLSMLGVEFDNCTVGIDLFSEKRDYAFFVSNDYLGCADKEYFWCQSVSTGHESLYRIGDCTNILSEYPAKAAEMRQYAQNMLYVSLIERFDDKKHNLIR